MNKVGELIKEALMEALQEKLNEYYGHDEDDVHIPEFPQTNNKSILSSFVRRMKDHHSQHQDNTSGSLSSRHGEHYDDYEHHENKIKKTKGSKVSDQDIKDLQHTYDSTKRLHQNKDLYRYD